MHPQGRSQREIEIKLRVKDVPGVIRDLLALGASAKGRLLERNTLYDTRDRFFRHSGRLLRLRTETPASSEGVRAGKRAALATFKAPAPSNRLSRYKEKFESEIPIPNPDRWAAQLEAIGFKPGFRYEKYRTLFWLPGVHACLDETPIGAFLELEGSPAAIDRAARQLGFRPRAYIRGTYWDLYAADCARRGVAPRNLLFNRVKMR